MANRMVGFRYGIGCQSESSMVTRCHIFGRRPGTTPCTKVLVIFLIFAFISLISLANYSFVTRIQQGSHQSNASSYSA